MSRTSSSGPEIGIPGRVSAGLYFGKNQNLSSGVPKAGRRACDEHRKQATPVIRLQFAGAMYRRLHGGARPVLAAKKTRPPEAARNQGCERTAQCNTRRTATPPNAAQSGCPSFVPSEKPQTSHKFLGDGGWRSEKSNWKATGSNHVHYKLAVREAPTIRTTLHLPHPPTHRTSPHLESPPNLAPSSL
jgi:hypothetical protein